MRPLRIELEGFTAFRERQIVALEDLDLFVITGPTGAGKSSLLDAMMFALFGKVPRMGGQGLGDLVSQGLAEARIQLDFSVGDERYRIARRLRRKGANSATLERAVGDRWHTEVGGGGVRAVDKRVIELVKLGFEAFTRAVVLPQGEFQRFLRGDREQRREVLSDLLGLGHYEAMGARARARIRVLDASIDATQGILEDQFADATAERLIEIKASLASASAIAQALADSVASADKLDRGAASLRAGRGSLDLQQLEIDAIRSALTQTLASAAKAQEDEGKLKEAVTEAEKGVTAAEKKVAKAQAQLAHVVEKYGSVEELVRAEGALQTHTQCQKDLLAKEKQLALLESELGALKTELATATAEAKALLKTLTKAKTGAEQAERVAQQAAHAELEAADRVELATQAEAELLHAKKHSSSCAKTLKEAKAASNGAREDAKAAESKYAQLTDENAAAGLARNLRAGDSCPVCHREVDSDPEFDEHIAEALAVAKGLRDERRERAAEAAGALATAEEANRTASERQDQAQAAIDQALKGVGTTKVLREEAKAAKDESRAGAGLLTQRREEAERAAAAESDARVALGSLQTTVTNKNATRDELIENCKELQTRVARAAAALRTQFKGEIPSGAEAQLKRRYEAVIAATTVVEAAQRDASTAQTQLHTAAAALTDLHDQLARIDTDVAGSTARVEGVHRQLGEAMATVGYDRQVAPLPTVAAARDSRIGDLLSWCDAAATTLSSADVAAEEALGQLDRELLQLAQENEVEVADGESPAAALKTAEQLARDTKVRSEEAVRQAEERLDQRTKLSDSIADKQRETSILRALASELRADRFIQFIIQQTLDLLAVRASEQLLKISGDRYSLASHDGEFSVIDHANADEQRSVKTLSGGETFLASLSLALALSQHVGELATEGLGAKLEAVFIDEGFGALDPETLEDVIDALERLRESNLMVGVITHVPALAERIRVGIRIEKQQNNSTVVDAAA